MKKIIEQFKIAVSEVSPETAVVDIDMQLLPIISKKMGIKEKAIISYKILGKSLDARKKSKLVFNFKIEIELVDSIKIEDLFLNEQIQKKSKNHNLNSLKIKNDLPKNPVVIGTGPAGLMTAYLLALYDLNPIIVDIGKPVEDRKKDIDAFFSERKANPKSNFLFGEGGAGTFSDGKLFTRTKDPKIKFILETFVKAGAPEEINYLKRPHIGSDILPDMVKNIRLEIEKLGGKFLWNSEVESLIIEKETEIKEIVLANGEKISAPVCFVAVGHSSRNLIKKMVESGIDHKLKDFQIGCRIEHFQKFIDQKQYGISDLPKCLSAAEYNLVNKPKGNTAGATTFCMCPGGIIVPVVTEEGQLSTNGMSRYARDSGFANSALIVNQQAENFSNITEIYNFIEIIEKAVFKFGGENYSLPAQKIYPFIRKEKGDLNDRETSYNLGIVPTRLDEILPAKTFWALVEALKYFEKVMPGFMKTGVLVGVETRISSPVRFVRNMETFQSSVNNLYIIGEGAGYASGIISAALDGLRAAEKYLEAPNS